jgi:hypothetical protein
VGWRRREAPRAGLTPATSAACRDAAARATSLTSLRAAARPPLPRPPAAPTPARELETYRGNTTVVHQREQGKIRLR